jgi:hypothetical protein
MNEKLHARRLAIENAKIRKEMNCITNIISHIITSVICDSTKEDSTLFDLRNEIDTTVFKSKKEIKNLLKHSGLSANIHLFNYLLK